MLIQFVPFVASVVRYVVTCIAVVYTVVVYDGFDGVATIDVDLDTTVVDVVVCWCVVIVAVVCGAAGVACGYVDVDVVIAIIYQCCYPDSDVDVVSVVSSRC